MATLPARDPQCRRPRRRRASPLPAEEQAAVAAPKTERVAEHGVGARRLAHQLIAAAEGWIDCFGMRAARQQSLVDRQYTDDRLDDARGPKRMPGLPLGGTAWRVATEQ